MSPRSHAEAGRTLPRRPASGPATPLAAAAVLLLVGSAVLGACRDDPAPPGPQTPAAQTTVRTPPPLEGTAVPAPPPPLVPHETAEQADARIQAWRADLNKQAHAVLDRFRAATYDPARDGGILAARGKLELAIDGKSGTYRFAFDGTAAQDAPPAMSTEREDADIHRDAANQARRFAVFATRGPASFVLSYLPPVQLALTRTKDGRELVVAPPFKSAMGVSYRVNSDGIVEMSGATDGKNRRRTVFHWTPRGKLWTLTRAVIEGGEVTVDYEFEERDGLSLLRRASIREGLHTCDATLTWEQIERR